MSRTILDSEITELLAEQKPLARNWESRLKPIAVQNQVHERRKLEITGNKGNSFVIDVRRNPLQHLDFSIILSFVDKDGERYILLRFNGKHSSAHTNKWEKKHNEPNSYFRSDFHKHLATERYQQEGFPIDGYAEVTSEYNSFESALKCFVQSNGFSVADVPRPLFDGIGND